MIAGKRATVASVLHDVGLTSLTLAARRHLAPTRLTVVNFHRVDNEEAARQFDQGTLDTTPDGLDRRLRLLRHAFTVIDPDDLLDYLGGRPWPPSPALITFDDGYRDNYERALPILQRHGLKALFFVATAYVANRRLFWWDRISYTVKHARRSRFEITYPSSLGFDLSGGPGKAERQLHRIAKRVCSLDFDRFLDELAAAVGLPWDEQLEHQLADQLIMTWTQVRALRTAGMGIGSHTRRHRVLATVPGPELTDELAGSRADLEAAIGEPVWTISYPVGAPIARGSSLWTAVEAAGYKVGFTYGTGAQRLRSVDPLNVSRHAIERDWSEARFLGALAFPWLR